MSRFVTFTVSDASSDVSQEVIVPGKQYMKFTVRLNETMYFSLGTSLETFGIINQTYNKSQVDILMQKCCTVYVNKTHQQLIR